MPAVENGKTPQMDIYPNFTLICSCSDAEQSSSICYDV